MFNEQKITKFVSGADFIKSVGTDGTFPLMTLDCRHKIITSIGGIFSNPLRSSDNTIIPLYVRVSYVNIFDTGNIYTAINFSQGWRNNLVKKDAIFFPLRPFVDFFAPDKRLKKVSLYAFAQTGAQPLTREQLIALGIRHSLSFSVSINYIETNKF